MYASFFGLKHEPFSIAPDPRFLYLSERHREALAHLLYGVKGGGGFVLLTGEIGAGKTTVCRAFLDQVPQDCEVAYIFNPKLTVHELLKAVCDEFGIEAPAAGTPGVTVQDYVEPLNRHLLEAHAAGRKCILIIDEAQNLQPEVLEQLRLLTNLETAERKLLQIILIGQPELREMVARPELEQLAQRIVARFHLGPLSAAETAQYVLHRMRVAGLGAHSPFTAQQLLQIHKLTGGVPRRINLLCDRALLGAYSRGQPQVDRQVVSHAALEVFDRRYRGERGFLWRQLGWGVGIACVAAGVGFVASAWQTGVLSRGDAGVPSAALAGVPQSPAASVAAVAAVGSGRELGAQEPLIGWADESAGWRALARGWGVELAGGEACDTARRASLVCYRSQASLALARQLDRPAILAWLDAAQRRQHVLLLGLDEREALLQGPEGRVRLPLARLATFWRGDYATLWRAPVGYLDPGSPAQLSPATFQWLNQALAGLPGLAEVAAGQPPQQQLRARIQAFQVTQGLQPDGLLGPVTVMRLNRAAGVDEPALSGLPEPAAERLPGS